MAHPDRQVRGKAKLEVPSATTESDAAVFDVDLEAAVTEAVLHQQPSPNESKLVMPSANVQSETAAFSATSRQSCSKGLRQ